MPNPIENVTLYCILGTVFFVGRGKMTERFHRFGMIMISALIVIILSVQAVASFCKCDSRGKAWPMVSYPMYAIARHDGERVHYDYELYAALDDGQRLRLSQEDLGLGSPTDLTERMRSFFIFQKNIVYPMMKGKREKLQPIVEQLCSRGRRPTRLEIYDFGVAVSRNGAVRGLEPELLAAVDADCN